MKIVDLICHNEIIHLLLDARTFYSPRENDDNNDDDNDGNDDDENDKTKGIKTVTKSRKG